MKLLSRDFTATERITILVLGLVLVALAYYQFVYRYVENGVAEANAERSKLQTELTTKQARLAQLQQMEEEMSRYALDGSDQMASYNNSKAEIKLLNDVLMSTSQYSISFAGVTREGDQIRRNFSLQFTTSSFDNAKNILYQLTHSEYRCLIDGLQYSYSTSENPNSNSQTTETASVSVTATFYETMVGGVEDAGLPAATKSQSDN